jgi:hypothetical protein
MEFLLFLVIGAFLFAVFGVIGLLGRTKRLNDELEELRRTLHALSDKLNGLSRPEKQSTNPPVVQTGEQPSPNPDIARLYGVSAAFEPATPPAALESVPERETVPGRIGQTPEPETQVSGSAPGGRIAAFIHSGNVWAAGGVLLLIAAFAMLMT